MSEQQKYFSTQDGTSLFYRYRPAADGSSDKAIVLFHRGHEHSGRMMFVADELGLMILPILLGTRAVMATALVNAAIVRVSVLRFQT